MKRSIILFCLLALSLTASPALTAPPGVSPPTTVSPPNFYNFPRPSIYPPGTFRPAGNSYVPPSYFYDRPVPYPRFVPLPPTTGSPPSVQSPSDIDPVDSWPFPFFRFLARESASQVPATKAAPARILVKLPADAALWVSGDFTTQTGPLREFNSPPISVGQKSWYVLRARWVEGEKYIDQTRKVPVTGGEISRVDFTAPEKE
jgi:uncharacterized protein (TIGR03000 family)